MVRLCSYAFAYNEGFLLKASSSKIEIFQKDHICVKSLSRNMDRNFRLNILTDDYHSFNVEITIIHYRHKIFDKNKNYKLNNVNSTEIASLLDKYIKDYVFLIENENILVGNNLFKGMLFIMHIKKVPSFGDCLKSLYDTFMKFN